MPASVFNAWRYYSEIEPFGAIRENYHIATLCALTANINRGKDQEAFTPADFIYKDPIDQADDDRKKAYNRTRGIMAQLKAAQAAAQKKRI